MSHASPSKTEIAQVLDENYKSYQKLVKRAETAKAFLLSYRDLKGPYDSVDTAINNLCSWEHGVLDRIEEMKIYRASLVKPDDGAVGCKKRRVDSLYACMDWFECPVSQRELVRGEFAAVLRVQSIIDTIQAIKDVANRIEADLFAEIEAHMSTASFAYFTRAQCADCLCDDVLRLIYAEM